MDSIGPGRQRPSAQVRVVVLADGEDGDAGRVGLCHGVNAVVGTCGQIHDDAIDLAQGRFEAGYRADRHRDRIGGADQVGQAGRPDQVIGEDRDAGGQSSDSAR